MYIKKKLHRLALVILTFFIAIISFCQDDISTITASFNQYVQHASQEKLFVHTDKNFYIAGEILWLKVYAVDITYNKPINISKVAYAEVLDTNNQPVLQAKIGMDGGTGSGSIYLPLTLHSGNYKLRTYTNWMKNGGPDCFFEKVITVVNVQKIAPQPEKEAITYQVQFFPEGGNLVAGLQSKVAFKVWDNAGIGVAANGVITDNGSTVLSFSTAHAGMGSFNFKPISNHTYKAVVQTEDNNIINKELPLAYASGVVMQVDNDGGKVNVHIQSNTPNNEAVYLLAYTGSAVKVAEKNTLQNGSAIFTFSPDLLGDGISHLTVFNARKQPLCERLYFKKPGAYLDITTAAQNEVDKRNKVNITVASPGLKSNDTAMLSMAVYRLDSIQVFD